MSRPPALPVARVISKSGSAGKKQLPLAKPPPILKRQHAPSRGKAISDQMIEANRRGHITPLQRASFYRDGYLHLHGVLPAEVYERAREYIEAGEEDPSKYSFVDRLISRVGSKISEIVRLLATLGVIAFALISTGAAVGSLCPITSRP